MTLVKIDINRKGVARVTLNRPDVHNAFNADLIKELTDCLLSLGRNTDVRVIVLTGEGKSFSAGADLNWMQQAAANSEDDNRADALRLAKLFETLNTCPKPVVGLINGAALGGGVGLTACCDIAIAGASAKFGLTEVRIGLTPATISPYVIARIGQGHARRYMLTGERFGATEALRIGLVSEISDDIEMAAQPIIEALLAGGPAAIADTKALIADVAGRPVTAELSAMTADRIAARRASVEGREGIAAFLEKRAPGWAE